MKVSVSFKNGLLKVAGELYEPANLDGQAKLPAIVVVHPAGGVKQQTAGLYAKHISEVGFIVLTYDATYQGESEGEPRYLQNPSFRVSDIKAGVDYLTTLKFVDEKRIGVLGICAGGGYAINASLTDHRIKAVGTVSAVNIGRLFRLGDPIKTLQESGLQRNLELKGGQNKYIRYFPDNIEEINEKQADIDIKEATQYYRTPRAQHKRSFNQRLQISDGEILGFDAFHLADKLLTQPLQVIVGDKIGIFGSYHDGHEIVKIAASKKKDILVVKGKSHIDLYDSIDESANKLIEFYKQNL